MKTYLVPTTTNGKDAVMEYMIETRKEDMRTRFYKENKNNTVDVVKLLNAIKNNSMIVKENRIIAPTAEAAKKFRKEVY